MKKSNNRKVIDFNFYKIFYNLILTIKTKTKNIK